MSFNTNVTIENIKTDGLTAYVYVKFLSPVKATEDLSYRFYTEYLDLQNILTWTDQTRYWIDKYTQYDTDFSTEVSIRRNKTIVLRFDLTQGKLVENRFVLNIKLHLKKEKTGTEYDETVWDSGKLTLNSREFVRPEVSCLYINNVNNKLKGKFKLKYKTSADKTLIENNAIFYVDIYSPNKLLKREKVELLPDEVTDFNYITFETAGEQYDERISKVDFVILLGGSSPLTTQSFVLDTLKNFSARLAEPHYFPRILNMYYKTNTNSKKIKNIFKKY
jgi:hypothetical protein